ncbi:DUF1294 domain-containing protein [Sandaracinobacteroides sp. A072]|uniref:DUF1294 domain-containing protein n=1 Tax=Sandaracinobacteroides sp. A072 TaxID=3461146 RepID=UPI0040433D0C
MNGAAWQGLAEALPGVGFASAPLLAGLLLAVNGWTLLRFREDKLRALHGLPRLPERRLLRLALIGGSPAALLATEVFRHKRRKPSFMLRLRLIAVAQAGLLLGLAIAGLMTAEAG